MDEVMVRTMIRDHYAAAGRDEARANQIYADDAVLDFPQGGERIRGKDKILAMRTFYPAEIQVEIRRTIGCGDVWINEGTIRYDGVAHNDVSIMEFRDGLVVHETIYVADPWDPPAWRGPWVEPMPTDPI